MNKLSQPKKCNKDEKQMIISRWNGFEIDSSEGYYFFQNDLENAEEGYGFLTKLLSSPLLWHKVSFALVPFESHKEYVEKQLRTKSKAGLITEIVEPDFYAGETQQQKDEYDYYEDPSDRIPPNIPPDYVTDIPIFTDIFNKLKNKAKLISVCFNIAPLKSLPPKEYREFHAWFDNQFSDKKEAEQMWKSYCEVGEEEWKDDSWKDDYYPEGPDENTDGWYDSCAFAGNFELYGEEPISYRFNVSAMEPSLMVYLLTTIVNCYDFKCGGSHHTINNAPDKLRSSPEGDYYFKLYLIAQIAERSEAYLDD